MHFPLQLPNILLTVVHYLIITQNFGAEFCECFIKMQKVLTMTLHQFIRKDWIFYDCLDIKISKLCALISEACMKQFL